MMGIVLLFIVFSILRHTSGRSQQKPLGYVANEIVQGATLGDLEKQKMGIMHITDMLEKKSDIV